MDSDPLRPIVPPEASSASPSAPDAADAKDLLEQLEAVSDALELELQTQLDEHAATGAVICHPFYQGLMVREELLLKLGAYPVAQWPESLRQQASETLQRLARQQAVIESRARTLHGLLDTELRQLVQQRRTLNVYRSPDEPTSTTWHDTI
jgi:hypothetical protein